MNILYFYFFLFGVTEASKVGKWIAGLTALR